MKVSVIIPVYNAEKYLRKAVLSALAQDETAEVILIEDNSSDNSLEICEKLEKKHNIVKLFRHPGGANKGAGESRNLGIERSSQDYIAFLDADDYYLANRFIRDKKIFYDHPDAFGVYNAVQKLNQDKDEFDERLIKINEKIPPEKLFENMIIGNKGFFHISGLTFRKKIFEIAGKFYRLKISEDTHMWLRIAATGNLYPGTFDNAVAVRRAHQENMMSNLAGKDFIFHRKIMWESLLEWAEDNKLSSEKIRLLEYGALINDSLEPAGNKTEFRTGRFIPNLLNYFRNHSFKENMQILNIFFQHTKNKIIN